MWKPRKSKSQGSEHVGDVFTQGLDVCLVTVHEDNEIVRIADDSPPWQALDAAPTTQRGSGHRSARLPWPHQVLIEPRQSDVGQQRRQDATLRRSGVSVLAAADLGEHTGFEKRLHQTQYAFVLDPQPHPIQESGM